MSVGRGVWRKKALVSSYRTLDMKSLAKSMDFETAGVTTSGGAKIPSSQKPALASMSVRLISFASTTQTQIDPATGRTSTTTSTWIRRRAIMAASVGGSCARVVVGGAASCTMERSSLVASATTLPIAASRKVAAGSAFSLRQSPKDQDFKRR